MCTGADSYSVVRNALLCNQRRIGPFLNTMTGIVTFPAFSTSTAIYGQSGTLQSLIIELGQGTVM